MKSFVKSTPGSYVEHSAEFVSWFYDLFYQEHGAMQARALVNDLVSGPLRDVTKSGDIEIVAGPGYVEARSFKLNRTRTYSAAIEAATYMASSRKTRKWSEYYDFGVIMADLPKHDDDAFGVFDSHEVTGATSADEQEGSVIRAEDIDRSVPKVKSNVRPHLIC